MIFAVGNTEKHMVAKYIQATNEAGIRTSRIWGAHNEVLYRLILLAT